MMPTKSEIKAASYDAFISYSRADKSFVQNLVKQLEKFSPPKALGRPPRRLRIFVDTKDLVGTSYYEAVENALIEAQKLIVVCSPSSRQSPYVEDEITRFLKSKEKTSKDVIPILLKGIANNEAQTPEDEALKAFPDVLYDHMQMPLAVDYTAFDFRTNKLDKGRYLNSWYVLLANVIEVERNDLEERDAKRRRRRRLILFAITGMVMTVLAITTVIALWQRSEAVAQRRQAYARQLAAQAQLSMSQILAKPHEGIKQAMASLQLAPSEEAVEALKTGIFRLPPRHVSQLAADESGAVPLAFSPDANWIIGASDKVLHIWRANNGASVLQEKLEGEKQFIGFTEDSHFALLINKAEGEATLAAELILIEMNGSEDKPKIRIHTFPRILDAVIAGNGVFALLSESTGKRTTAYDVLREEPMGAVELGAAAILGSLDKSTGESVIVDASGKVHLLGYGFKHRKVAFEIPAGEHPLAIGIKPTASPERTMGIPKMNKAGNKVLISRRKDKGLTIYSVQNGAAIRQIDAKLASQFVKFIAEGAVFAANGTESGPNIFTIEGEYLSTLTHSRATDWDLTKMGKIGRQTPILDIGASKDGQTIVTARKDGRISVWRSGSRPRPGGWGAMPMPELESIAHFDHGQEFGDKVTWRRFPILSVSPDGRYIGSQSMGLETNPVGGIKSLNPLLRIWDVGQRKEIARFYPNLFMSLAFAPSRNLLLSVSQPRADVGDSDSDERAYRLDVWQLSPYLFEPEQAGKTTRHPIPVMDTGESPSAYKHRIVIAANGRRAVWIDGDFKLRVWDKSSGKVATLETLRPIIESLISEQAKQLIRHSASFVDKSLDVEEMPKVWIKTLAENPVMMPLALPLKISEDGSRALLAIGTSLRLYDLSNRQILMERSLEDISILNGMLLSANGKFFVAYGIPWKSYEAQRKPRENQRRGKPAGPGFEIRVYAVDQEEPLKVITFSMIPFPIPLPDTIPLAMGPKGRWLVVDKIDTPSEPSATALPSRKIAVIDVLSGQSRMAFFSEPFSPPHPMDFAGYLKTKGAVFSGDGRFLAIRRTESECPTSTITNTMTLMPMHVPTCPELKVTYTVWNLKTQKRSLEIERIVESDFKNLFPSPPRLPTLPAAVERNEWTRRRQSSRAQANPVASGADGTKTEAVGSSERKSADDPGNRNGSIRESFRMGEIYSKLAPFGGFSLTGMAGFGASSQIAFTLESENSIKVTHAEQDPESGGMVLITQSLDSSGKPYPYQSPHGSASMPEEPGCRFDPLKGTGKSDPQGAGHLHPPIDDMVLPHQ